MSDEEYELAKNAWGLQALPQETENKLFALQTLIWSAKESIYKWYGDGLVDFKEHMVLCDFVAGSPEKEQELSFTLQKGKPRVLRITGRFFGSMVLTWVIS